MSRLAKTLQSLRTERTNKASIFLLLREYWKFITTILIIICFINFCVYLNHINRLHLLIDLIRDNKTDLIIIIIPFAIVCLLFLIILCSSGLISVIYLNELQLYEYPAKLKFYFVTVPISASALPTIIYSIFYHFIPNNESNSLSIFWGSIILTIILSVILYFCILKRTGLNKKIQWWQKIFCFFCLAFMPFTMFHLTSLLMVFRFIDGETNWLTIALLGGIIIVFAIISQIPLMCYFANIRIGKYLDKNQLLVRTVKGSFCFSLFCLVLIFLFFPKVFIFASYLSLRPLGIADLSSNYKYSIIKNESTSLRLQENNWNIYGSFDDKFTVIGTLGFHLGDINLICKANFKKTFSDSLRYDLAQNKDTTIKGQNCIVFNRNEIDILFVEKWDITQTSGFNSELRQSKRSTIIKDKSK